MTKAKKKDAQRFDILDEFMTDAITPVIDKAIQLMFWRGRMENRGFTIEIHPSDIRGFDECCKYLGVTPQIRILRPQGLPAREAIPAQGNRRAIPARPAQPPKNYVVIQMVDQEGNTFVPIENNEGDLKEANRQASLRKMKEGARELANQVASDMQQNVFTTGTISELVATVRALAAA